MKRLFSVLAFSAVMAGTATMAHAAETSCCKGNVCGTCCVKCTKCTPKCSPKACCKK